MEKNFEKESVTATGSTGVSPNCDESVSKLFFLSAESVLSPIEHMSCNMVDLLKLNTTQLRNARLARQIMRNL